MFARQVRYTMCFVYLAILSTLLIRQNEIYFPLSTSLSQICLVCIVACFKLSCVYCCHPICICCTIYALLLFTFDARLLARSQYSEGPATDHLDKVFSWFPCA